MQFTFYVKAGTDCANCPFSRQIHVVFLILQLRPFMSTLPYVQRHTLAEFYPECKLLHYTTVGWDRSVGIETRYGLDGLGIESRWIDNFRTPPDRHWGPPSLLYNGYRIFPGGKAAGAWR